MMALLRKKTYQKMADDHSSKIARLLYRDVDVDEHINNISSYNLTFFDKLVLCRGLQFSIPQPCISDIDIKASFEKVSRKIEPMLADVKKELTAATLCSIDHFRKWRPTLHSFVFMLIRPTALVLKQIFF